MSVLQSMVRIMPMHNSHLAVIWMDANSNNITYLRNWLRREYFTYRNVEWYILSLHDSAGYAISWDLNYVPIVSLSSGQAYLFISL